jgi:hypothetical protein
MIDSFLRGKVADGTWSRCDYFLLHQKQACIKQKGLTITRNAFSARC